MEITLTLAEHHEVVAALASQLAQDHRWHRRWQALVGWVPQEITDLAHLLKLFQDARAVKLVQTPERAEAA